MSIQSVTQFECGKWRKRRVVAQAVEQNLTTDTGLLLFGQFDEKLGWTKQFAALITDGRRAPSHSVLEMVRQRIFGIIAGYEDQNDHDTLRTDAIFKMLAGREPSDDDLASQPTISRLENSVTARMLLDMQQWMLEKFVKSFYETPEQITLDIDTYDDPTHGEQQLTFWHGYYGQMQYQVRLITCAENDQIAFPVLLFGSASAKLGAAQDLSRVIRALRERFPNVRIYVRADSGFGGPDVYEALESFDNLVYTIGMKLNEKTKKLSESLLEEAVAAQAQSGADALRYMSVLGYSSKSWGPVQRDLVLKCEATAHSCSRRGLLTNDPDAATYPELVYRDYAYRGESENRNKELKCGLAGDRLSDHRYMANLFRLMMHSVAHNLLVMLRQQVAEVPRPVIGTPPPVPANQSFRETKADRKVHNDRRRDDPLGAGHACTWRTLVIKVAARVFVSARRVVLQLAASWPNLEYFRKVAQAITNYRPHPA